ncbi:metalloregulator ArsR/SmtB family transcription factor [Alcanivorax sp.]|uniref:ArsR/SmtB family transcription factor n=1 Tax=Alcanivorax sp. TaxID=1872427 RepID=UPI0025C03374|nr:metalloregulator ArsR/SmtB family transcription factor [Alcanivorax sp.]
MNAQAPDAPEITDHLAGFLKAAGDPLRLQVLQVLGQNSFGVLELCDIMAMKQSGMSHHLKVLAQGGLVEKRREGNSIFYRRRLPQADSVEGALHEALLAELDDGHLDPGVAERLEQVQSQRAEQSRAYFARHAEQVDHQQELIADYEQYAEQALELLTRACPEGGTALEIGPGDGQFLLELAARFDSVLGLDNAEAMLERARQSLAVAKRQNVQLILGEWPASATTLPTADAVVLNMVLHHLPAPASAISAAARQLNDGGTLLITDLCRHDQHWAHEACGDFWLGFEEADLVDWAGRAGLELQESQFLALRNGFQVQVRTFRKSSK